MSVGRIVGIALTFTLFGGIIGGVLGWAINLISPDFFPALLHGPYSSSIGMAIGATNGLIMGFVLAIVVVLCMAFGRRNEGASQRSAPEDA